MWGGVGWEARLSSSDSSPQLPFCTQGYKMKDGGAIHVWEPYCSSLPTLFHNCSSNSGLEYLIKSYTSFEKTLTSLHIWKLLIHQSPPFQTSSGKYEPRSFNPCKWTWGKFGGLKASISSFKTMINEWFIHSSKLGDSRESKWGCKAQHSKYVVDIERDSLHKDTISNEMWSELVWPEYSWQWNCSGPLLSGWPHWCALT